MYLYHFNCIPCYWIDNTANRIKPPPPPLQSIDDLVATIKVLSKDDTIVFCAHEDRTLGGKDAMQSKFFQVNLREINTEFIVVIFSFTLTLNKVLISFPYEVYNKSTSYHTRGFGTTHCQYINKHISIISHLKHYSII